MTCCSRQWPTEAGGDPLQQTLVTYCSIHQWPSLLDWVTYCSRRHWPTAAYISDLLQQTSMTYRNRRQWPTATDSDLLQQTSVTYRSRRQWPIATDNDLPQQTSVTYRSRRHWPTATDSDLQQQTSVTYCRRHQWCTAAESDLLQQLTRGKEGGANCLRLSRPVSDQGGSVLGVSVCWVITRKRRHLVMDRPLEFQICMKMTAYVFLLQTIACLWVTASTPF